MGFLDWPKRPRLRHNAYFVLDLGNLYVSGAFDQVFKFFMLAKFHACGVGSAFLNFFDPYLATRKGQVSLQFWCPEY